MTQRVKKTSWGHFPHTAEDPYRPHHLSPSPILPHTSSPPQPPTPPLPMPHPTAYTPHTSHPSNLSLTSTPLGRLKVDCVPFVAHTLHLEAYVLFVAREIDALINILRRLSLIAGDSWPPRQGRVYKSTVYLRFISLSIRFRSVK